MSLFNGTTNCPWCNDPDTYIDGDCASNGCLLIDCDKCGYHFELDYNDRTKVKISSKSMLNPEGTLYKFYTVVEQDAPGDELAHLARELQRAAICFVVTNKTLSTKQEIQ